MEELRPTWVATLSTAGASALAVLLMVVLLGAGWASGLLWAAALAAVLVLYHFLRWLRLDASGATAHNIVTTRTAARQEVRAVRGGGWLRGGLVLDTARGRIWAPVGDRPFGMVSADRLRQVREWAAGS